MHQTDHGLVVVSALARSIASARDPAAICGAIAEAAVQSLGARVARVWLNDEASATLTAAASFGVNVATEQALLDVARLRHGTGVPGRVVLTRVPEFISDAHDDPRWANRRYIHELNLRAYVGLPLVSEGAVVGVLSILFDAPRAFTDNERALAGILADYAAITLRIAGLYEDRRRADALEAVNRLARAAAHELNNPLAVVVGQAELLIRLLNDRSDATARVGRILEAGARMASIVWRMNHLVRLEVHPGFSDLPLMLDLERSADTDSDESH